MPDLFKQLGVGDETPDTTQRPTKAEATPVEKLRLQKNAGAEIAAYMEAEGFRAEARGNNVYVWDAQNTHLATFSWLKGKGWMLQVRQPTIYTRHDLALAVEEIQRCRSGSEAVDEAWAKYKKTKTDKNWAAYQGALAAHFFRLYGGKE